MMKQYKEESSDFLRMWILNWSRRWWWEFFAEKEITKKDISAWNDRELFYEDFKTEFNNYILGMAKGLEIDLNQNMKQE